MKPRSNPLFAHRVRDPRIDATKLADATHLQGQERRDFVRRFCRGQTAKEAIADWRPPLSMFGFTKGQFSLSDLLDAVLDKIGPAALDVSTWTAGHADIRHLDKLLHSGRIANLRLLVDGSFAQRQPQILKSAVDRFGNESIRVCNNHAKFMLLRNDAASVAIKTSMNLNYNPRFEDFDITCDPGLCDFLQEVVGDLWEQARGNLTKKAAMEAFGGQING